MKLGQKITTYINELGVEGAAKTFNRAPSTIKTWLKTESYPMDVVEKFLEINTTEAPAEIMREHTDEAYKEESSLSLEDRVTAIENYLTKLNEYQQQAPVSTGGVAPTVAWAPPEPNDANFKSFVRPERGVAGRTLSTPAPTPIVKDTTPSEHWLKARPLPPRN